MEKPAEAIQREAALPVPEPMKLLLLSCSASVLIALSHNFPAVNLVFIFAYLLLFSVFQHWGLAKGLIMTTIAITAATIAVVVNPFFLSQPLLFLLLILFMVAVFVPEVLVLYLLSSKWNFTLVAVFLFVLAWRLLFCLVPGIFPFWWSAPFQLIPLAGAVSQWILPPFIEAIFLSLVSGIYCGLQHGCWRRLSVQLGILLLLSVGITHLSNGSLSDKKTSELTSNSIVSIGFSQLAYSAEDYGYAEKYLGFAKQIAQDYQSSVQDIPSCRLLILPESSFVDYDPVHQEVLSQIAQIRNCYILAGMLLEDDGGRYNCAILFPPSSKIPVVRYRKQNLVPIVEGGTLTSGTREKVMLVDGLRILPLICFDTMYPSSYQSRESVDLAVSISSDVFAEGTSLARCHQAYSVFYARTFRLPLVQVTQNGATFCIHGDGNLEEVAAPYQKIQDVTELLIRDTK